MLAGSHMGKNGESPVSFFGIASEPPGVPTKWTIDYPIFDQTSNGPAVGLPRRRE